MDMEQEADNQILITDTLLNQEIDVIIVFGMTSYNNSHFPNNR